MAFVRWPVNSPRKGAFVRWPVNSPRKGPVTRKMFPLRTSSWPCGNIDETQKFPIYVQSISIEWAIVNFCDFYAMVLMIKHSILIMNIVYFRARLYQTEAKVSTISYKIVI